MDFFPFPDGYYTITSAGVAKIVPARAYFPFPRSRNVRVRRAVEATARPPDFAGSKRAAFAARDAASSSSGYPLDATTATRSTDPDAETSISSTTSPCSPRILDPFG